MRKLFLALLVGAMVLCFSGVAGAAKWQTIESLDGLPIRMDLPPGFLDKGQEKREIKNGEMYLHIFENQEGTVTILIQKIIPPFSKENQKLGKYSLDQYSKEKKESYLQGFQKEGMKAEYIPLASGHESIQGEKRMDGSHVGKFLFVYSEGTQVMVFVLKKGEWNREEEKMAKKIFNSLEF